MLWAKKSNYQSITKKSPVRLTTRIRTAEITSASDISELLQLTTPGVASPSKILACDVVEEDSEEDFVAESRSTFSLGDFMVARDKFTGK